MSKVSDSDGRIYEATQKVSPGAAKAYEQACQPAEAEGAKPDAFEVARHSKRLVEQLRDQLAAVTDERDRLESMLLQTTTRHFAQQWKDSADDKKLDECLSEGIAMLEAERNQYRDMAACMDLLRRDMIEAGIVGESCPPMFMTEGVMAYIAQLRAEVEGLRKDAERLDRLDLECEAYGFEGIHEGNRWMIDGPFRTVRDAIDAALAAKEA